MNMETRHGIEVVKHTVNAKSDFFHLTEQRDALGEKVKGCEGQKLRGCVAAASLTWAVINASPQQVSQENYRKSLRPPGVLEAREESGRGKKRGGGEGKRVHLALTTLRPFS
ncbi:hypothetical protein E2C01_045688 [Portunus trituberculatus]|uniref:Uncharacterized protein n=1 Tax=Portunus trituberculatus TaxID=210409 RepID=A0A5B7G5Q2_PORTR|nr:hypothetical protein [Portunus trituberculatus]